MRGCSATRVTFMSKAKLVFTCPVAEKLPVIGNDVAGMAAFIPETGGLVAMGYGACSCFPIVIAGETRGVIALLGDAGIFTPDALAEIDTLLPIAALIFTFEGISER